MSNGHEFKLKGMWNKWKVAKICIVAIVGVY